jgi:DNA-binding transcriptional MerR regulator
MSPSPTKSASAFRTIGELAGELGVPQHILRYWETRFPKLRPLQRAGGRRYYRPEDVALVRQIHQWLAVDGYTVKGVQKLLTGAVQLAPTHPVDAGMQPSTPGVAPDVMARIKTIRDRLAHALAADDIGARL